MLAKQDKQDFLLHKIQGKVISQLTFIQFTLKLAVKMNHIDNLSVSLKLCDEYIVLPTKYVINKLESPNDMNKKEEEKERKIGMTLT